MREIAGLVSRELRETDMLAADATTVSMVLLDADSRTPTRVIERVMARLEHYQFTTPRRDPGRRGVLPHSRRRPRHAERVVRRRGANRATLGAHTARLRPTLNEGAAP